MYNTPEIYQSLGINSHVIIGKQSIQGGRKQTDEELNAAKRQPFYRLQISLTYF